MSSFACKDCASGALHGGTPKGTVQNTYDLPCYIAEPPAGQEPKGIVVILPDAFGWELVNNRIMADNYAEKGGFRVLLPDLMNGSLASDVLYSMETVTDSNASIVSRISAGLHVAANGLPWMFFNRISASEPRIHTFLRKLRDSTSLPVGAAGFCWGGKFVTLMASGQPKTSDGTKPLIDCGFTAHPSWLVLPADAQAITLPYSVAHATEDAMLTPEKFALLKQELEKKSNCEYVEYQGAKHGFAVRGDPDDEKVKKQGEEAEDQAVRFFDKWLSSS